MNDDSLLQEVDAALRHDAMVALWKRYRTPIFTVVALIIATTGGSEAWQAYQHHRAGQATFLFAEGQASFAKGNYDTALNQFGDAAKAATNPEMQDMAHLWQGRSYLQGGNVTEAANTLARLAEYPKSKNLIWRDLACLTVMGIAPQNSHCLDAMGDSPLTENRRLLHAAEQWKAGDSKAAKVTLEALRADEKTSAAVRIMAQEWLSVM